MKQIEKHSKIAIGLRKGATTAQIPAGDGDDPIEQLDMF
jgi:hypothetical protein